MVREFVFPVRIYYEDTDAAGVVYHSNYLKFMERARTEMLRDLGYDASHMAEIGNLMVVHKAELEFLKPAKLGELLEIVTTIKSSGKIKFIFGHTVRLAQEHAKIFCRGLITIVNLDKDWRPKALGAKLLESLKNDS